MNPLEKRFFKPGQRVELATDDPYPHQCFPRYIGKKATVISCDGWTVKAQWDHLKHPSSWRSTFYQAARRAARSKTP